MRLFFALWPGTAARAGLHAAVELAHRMYGGKPSRAETLHLTLNFLGEVDEAATARVLEAAATVRAATIAMAFDRLDCWRHNRIAYLAMTRPPDELLELAGTLARVLREAQLPSEHRPYFPHVTLLRKAACEKKNPAPEPVLWTAQDFVLVKSSLRPEGARYEQLGRWPLL